MRQQSFAADDFEKYRKKTRKEVILEEMDRIVPWKALSKVIKPYFPKPKGAAGDRLGFNSRLMVDLLRLSRAAISAWP